MKMSPLELLKKSEDNIDWFSENFDMLAAKFDQKFVAINNCEIVATGKILEDVIENLKLKNIDPSETLIQFVSKIAIVL